MTYRSLDELIAARDKLESERSGLTEAEASTQYLRELRSAVNRLAHKYGRRPWQVRGTLERILTEMGYR